MPFGKVSKIAVGHLHSWSIAMLLRPQRDVSVRFPLRHRTVRGRWHGSDDTGLERLLNYNGYSRHVVRQTLTRMGPSVGAQSREPVDDCEELGTQ